jgi:phage host-nuclease inhibitor protein Gam
MINPLAQSGSQLDQMRELMLGPHIREYTQRLEQLESTLVQLLEGSQRHFNEVQDSFTNELQTAIAASDKKIGALDLKTGEERAELRHDLEQLERKLNGRLEKLEADLTALQVESRKRLEGMYERLTSALEAIGATNERLQVTTSQLQEEGGDLQRQAKRTEERLDFRVRALNEEITSSTTSLRQELTKVHKATKDDLQALKTQLFNELDRQFHAMREAKVSREDISEIFLEFGMRLKGINFPPEFPQLPAAGGAVATRGDGSRQG